MDRKTKTRRESLERNLETGPRRVTGSGDPGGTCVVPPHRFPTPERALDLHPGTQTCTVKTDTPTKGWAEVSAITVAGTTSPWEVRGPLVVSARPYPDWATDSTLPKVVWQPGQRKEDLRHPEGD